LKIIVVEDELQILEGIASLIKKQSSSDTVILTAENGEEALKLMEQGSEPDLVITDIFMPIMSGINLIKKIREYAYECEIAILSGHADFNVAKQAINSNVLDYILKPIDKSQLSSLLKTMQKKLEKKQKANLLKLLYEILLHGISEEELPIDFSVLTKVFPYESFVVATSLGNRESFNYGLLKIKLEDAFDSVFTMETISSQYAQNTISIVNFPKLPKNGDISVIQKAFESCAADLVCISDPAVGYSNLSKLYMQSSARLFKMAAFEQFAEPEILKSNVSAPYINASKLLQLLENGKGNICAPVEEFLNVFDWSGDFASVSCRFIYVEILSLVYMHLSSAGTPTDVLSICFKGLGSSILRVDSKETLKTAILSDMSLLEGYGYAPSTKNESVVSAVKDYIKANYAKDININLAANLVHLHPNYLSSIFKQQTNSTIIQYLHNIRIEKVKEMLITNHSLAADKAGLLAGYDNPSHFFKVFKKVTGITPSQYRASYKIAK
jgi:AraC-like DNA-binding protein/CheY-like chemotaxis protein